MDVCWLNALKAFQMRSPLSLSVSFHFVPRLLHGARLKALSPSIFKFNSDLRELELNYEERMGNEA